MEELLRKGIDVGPEGIQVQEQALTASKLVLTLAGREGHDVAAVSAQLVDGDDAVLRVDEPVEADAKCGVLEKLLDAIANLVPVGRGENLDGDERGKLEQGSTTGRGRATEVDGDVRLAAA